MLLAALYFLHLTAIDCLLGRMLATAAQRACQGGRQRRSAAPLCPPLIMM